MTHQSDEGDFAQLLQENVPLAQFTTFGVGGPARFFADATTSAAMATGLSWAHAKGLPVFVLGGGSNVIIADRGFPGLVLRNAIAGLETSVENEHVIVAAGGGEDWDGVVARCVERRWAGFECLSGIPGSVGATPIQNVGAYGQEVAETIVAVSAIDTQSCMRVEFTNSECEFDYRTSRFKVRDRGRFVITRVTYRLSRNGKPKVRYMELQLRLTGAGIREPSLADVREAVLAIRRSKAMVIDPADPDSRSVGSFFINPVVTPGEFEKIQPHAARRGVNAENIPTFPAGGGKVKLAAAWLIEHSGFEKGYRYGNVGISKKHALAIVNRGGGTAREVLELAGRIKFRVRETFGVTLVPEPLFVGFDS
ncbi:MAG TPA: UDP-N-acetylmuramate dehydrogenase [Blastocatellia bacterium]|nr:UDP-N-acetylmuramate dehydrogenase [Blastocatellia bacterium]